MLLSSPADLRRIGNILNILNSFSEEASRVKVLFVCSGGMSSAIVVQALKKEGRAGIGAGSAGGGDKRHRIRIEERLGSRHGRTPGEAPDEIDPEGG